MKRITILLCFLLSAYLRQQAQTVSTQSVPEDCRIPDVIRTYSQNTLQQLQEKDTISIAFTSIGCFSFYSCILTITKEEGKFVARLYKDIRSYKGKGKKRVEITTRGEQVTSAVMTEKNITDFTRFENELIYALDGGCTTIGYYEITSKYWNTKKTDGSCSWNGFYHLRKSFFGDKVNYLLNP